jgi:hypothetical protein
MAKQQVQKEPQQQRNDLVGEHTLGDAGQLVLACLFVATWVLDSFVLKYTAFLNQAVPLAIRVPLGVVLLALSGYLATMGLHMVFGEKRVRYHPASHILERDSALSWSANDEFITCCCSRMGHNDPVLAPYLAVRGKAVTCTLW